MENKREKSPDKKKKVKDPSKPKKASKKPKVNDDGSAEKPNPNDLSGFGAS